MAVAHGTANAKKVMENIKAGGEFAQCHFIEFMGCPGGCIGGGGQPIPTSPEIRKARARAIYAEDAASEVRKSHENPAVLKLYNEFLTDGPCGHVSHKLLHTTTRRAASSSAKAEGGLRAQAKRLRAQGSGLKPRGSGLKAQGSRQEAQGSGLRPDHAVTLKGGPGGPPFLYLRT